MPHRFVPRSYNHVCNVTTAVDKAGLKAFHYEVTQTVVERGTPPAPGRQPKLKSKYIPCFTARSLEEYRLISSKGFACTLDIPRPPYECHRIAFLASAHVTMLTATLMMGGKKTSWVHSEGYGMMLRVRRPTDPDMRSFPEDLQKVFDFLSKDDVEFVVFDRDIPPIEELEVFPW